MSGFDKEPHQVDYAKEPERVRAAVSSMTNSAARVQLLTIAKVYDKLAALMAENEAKREKLKGSPPTPDEGTDSGA